MRNQSNKRPSTLICSNNINNFFFDETKSWTSFGKKFADFRYVLMKFLIFFHCETSVNMSNPNVIFFIGYVLVDYRCFWRSFLSNSWKIWRNSCTLRRTRHITGSPSERDEFLVFFWRTLLIGNFLSTFNNWWSIFFIGPCQNFNIQENSWIFFCHYAATNCCIFATLIEIFFGIFIIFFYTFYGRR